MPAVAAASPISLLTLPSLALRSLTVLVGLYAVLGVVLIAVVEAGVLNATVALLIAVAVAAGQFLLSPWLMDFSLRWFYQMHWATPGELPEAVDGFIRSVCEREQMKYPRMGIIEDGAPNAFTYGQTPSNARVIVTRGLFELLDTDELNAVIAHELGHARHWDILVMTVANLVPFLLYYIFRTLSRVRLKKEAESVRIGLIVVAYLLYLVSEYVVLWLSRIREYYADRFSGDVTGNPAVLASALVKIGYGLAGRGYTAEDEKEASAPLRRSRRGTAAGPWRRSGHWAFSTPGPPGHWPSPAPGWAPLEPAATWIAIWCARPPAGICGTPGPPITNSIPRIL